MMPNQQELASKARPDMAKRLERFQAALAQIDCGPSGNVPASPRTMTAPPGPRQTMIDHMGRIPQSMPNPHAL
jgi:hypothetical protein